MASAHKDTSDKNAKKDRSKSEEEKLDDALDNTFPASDPLSVTDPAEHLGGARKTGHRPGGPVRDKGSHR